MRFVISVPIFDAYLLFIVEHKENIFQHKHVPTSIDLLIRILYDAERKSS